MQQVEIAENFQKEGIVHLEDIISPEHLKILKEFTLLNLEENQNKSFFLTSKSNKKISSFFKENSEIYEKIKSIIFDLSKKLFISYPTKSFYVLMHQKFCFSFHKNLMLFVDQFLKNLAKEFQ